MSEFDRATQVSERPRVEASESPSGDGEPLDGRTPKRRIFDARVHDGWDIGGPANGGYLLALAARAMAASAGRPPLTVTAHYLAPVPPGPIEIVVRTVRLGRRMATMSATMIREQAPVLEVLGTFAEQSDAGVQLSTGAPPDLAPYDSDEELVIREGVDVPALQRRLAVRLRPGDEGFALGRPTGRAEIAGWFAFADAAPIDAIGLLLVADAFAPPIFNSGLAMGWVPTAELTVHVRAEPAPGPLACRFASRFVQGGLLEEDGEIWDVTGRLVAQSRQLALIPRT